MDKNILECILKNKWRDTCLEKILSIESSPAVEKNLNFLSTVNRLKLKVLLGNGKIVNKSLVAKDCNITLNFLSEFNEKYETFKTETMMYNKLKEIEYLMEEFDDSEDVLWCRMVHHIPYNYILMEDLQAKGFDLIDRIKFYDLDHILLSVHSLGRYHGMCKALEERGEAPQNLKTWFLFGNLKMQNFMYWDLQALKRAIIKQWDPSWKPIAEKIKITETELNERLVKFSELDETKFNVTNHGDCHKNNILIKYGWNERPIAMRFLDFQLVHYGSPCVDLTYMVYLTTYPSVRRENFDLILRMYHNSLVTTLDKFQFQGKKPDIEEIREGMQKHSFMGLMLSITWFPFLLQSDKMDILRDSEKVIATEGKEGYSDKCFLPEVLEEHLGPDIKDFVHRFVDFQLIHYGSPCIDLTFMMSLAAIPSVRRDNFELILRGYHNALINTLDKYRFQGKKPDIEEIRDGMEMYSFLRLMLALSWFPYMLTSDKADELRNSDKIIDTEGTEGYSDECFLPEVLEEHLGPDIKAFVDMFCSDS